MDKITTVGWRVANSRHREPHSLRAPEMLIPPRWGKGDRGPGGWQLKEAGAKMQ